MMSPPTIPRSLIIAVGCLMFLAHQGAATTQTQGWGDDAGVRMSPSASIWKAPLQFMTLLGSTGV